MRGRYMTHFSRIAGLLSASTTASRAGVRRTFAEAEGFLSDRRVANIERFSSAETAASNYDRNVRLPERLLFSGGREWVCARAEGEVLEIAAGTGRNLPHYPDGVRLTGIECVPAMLEVARRRAVELGRPVELRLGDAQALQFEDATFDTVVCTLSLCTIPDDRAAMAEVRRVLRPGGRFVLLEHVRSPVRAVRAVQRLLAPVFVRFGADHLLLEPLEHVQDEGFSIELLERSKLGLVERLLARKPGPG